MIKVKNISKKYSQNIVLNNISFTTPKNSITGIIGANGAGKSTLIKIITGFEFSDSGSLYINDKKMTQFIEIKKQISYMPEKMTLYPEYFVKQFLDFYHSIFKKDKELLNILSLEKIFNKQIKHLSKGWHQRLKLYTALCNKKKIVILDEPFEGFDPLQMREIAEIIRIQNRTGREFILSIHQLSYAQKICNHFIILNNGKLIADGSIEFLSKKYSTKKDLEEILLKIIQKK